MKRLLSLLAVAIACPMLAQPNQSPDGPRPSPEQLMQQFDRNGDGKISRDEAPERMKQRWEQIDTDHDGFVTLEELKARDARVNGLGQRAERPPAPPASTHPNAALAVRPGTRAFVNAANAGGQHDGKTWATAFATLQDALTVGAAEIWVAAGTYTPGRDRSATFQLRMGGAMYGGFAGNEFERDQRDWQTNKTILDGHSAYHVVTGADGAVLDGFTITGGNGLGGPREGSAPSSGGGRPIHTTPQAVMGGAGASSGAGMLNYRASPTVRNCIFENNQAGKGGAVYNMTSSSFPPRPDAKNPAPVFINCAFRNNSAQGRGGGVSNDLGTAPTFLNCVFDGNETPQKGGGMYNDFGCSPTLINCLFTGNNAQSAGGMGNDGGSSPVLYYCTFTRNHAVDCGAPLYEGTGPASNPSLICCLISGNLCDWEAPGIYNWHDNTPLIKESTTGDAGYKPARFTEAQLPQLLADLQQYRAQPVREAVEAEPERIPSAQRIVYANATNDGNGDGRSWATAYGSLQAALDEAGKDGAEVRVSAGTFKLGVDRSRSFVLRPGIRVYGGCRGNERYPAGQATVLDGNHAYHVVVAANGAVLDGFIITGGCADGMGYDGKGGGLINYRRAPQDRPNAPVIAGYSPRISHCTFTNNFARDGGAVYSYDRAKPVFSECIFAGNRSENGGAVLDRVGVESVFEKCQFIGNDARWRGGALYFDYGSRPKLTGCIFRNNTTGGHGGAAFSLSRASQLENTIVTFADCRFEDNTAKGNGGAAAFCDNSVASVQKCAFSGNKAGHEGNDTYIDSSSSDSAEERTRPAGANEPIRGADGRRGPGQGMAGGPAGRPRGRMGGENLPTHFQPSAGFSVIIVGSGGPPYDPKRSGPSAAIQYRGRFILVDMGNGTQARLYEAGISLSQIDAFLVTHHHRDHNEEFMPMLNSALARGLPLEIVGPPGTKKLADFTAEFYAEDLAYRVERMGRSAQDIPKPNVREIQGGERFGLDSLQVTTAQVPHSIHTIAYRFDVGGQSIVISGDLTYSDNLIALAHEADVLVIDSGGSVIRPGAHRSADVPAGRGREEAAHASSEEVCAMAQKSGARKLVLTHIVAQQIDEDRTLAAIRETYKGQVLIGQDLLEVAPGKR